LNELIVCAVEREVELKPALGKRRVKFPLIHRRGDRKIDLSGFDFDDLLG